VIAGAIAVIAIYAATLSIARNRTDAAREFSVTSFSLGLWLPLNTRANFAASSAISTGNPCGVPEVIASWKKFLTIRFFCLGVVIRF
jgi:hypothetical protein